MNSSVVTICKFTDIVRRTKLHTSRRHGITALYSMLCMRRSQKLRVPEGVGPLVCGDALVLPKADPAMEYPAWPAGVLRCEDRRITLWLARDRRKRQLERNPGGEQLMALHSRHQRCGKDWRRGSGGSSSRGRPSNRGDQATARARHPSPTPTSSAVDDLALVT